MSDKLPDLMAPYVYCPLSPDTGARCLAALYFRGLGAGRPGILACISVLHVEGGGGGRKTKGHIEIKN